MAYFRNTSDVVPSADASYGLIYRLNWLWQIVNTPAINGDYDKWNFILDRIYCNLLYRNEFDVSKNDKGKIVDVSLDDEDRRIYYLLNRKIITAKEKLNKVKIRKEYDEARAELYQALMLKDIGLRKFMHKLGLYMKEVDHNPSRAMWGGTRR